MTTMLRTVLACLALMTACSDPVMAQAAPHPAPGWQPPKGSLGMNLGVVSNIYQAIPFVDAMKESAPFAISSLYVAPGTPISGQSVIGPDGWVKSLATNQQAKACMFTGAHGYYPQGVYTLLYDGNGKIGVIGNAELAVIGKRPGEIRVQVTPHRDSAGDSGICIAETAVDHANPIRNIRFILPGGLRTYQTDPFYPPFLNALKPFGVLRFIGWDRSDTSPEIHWSDRRPATYPTQGWNPATRVTDTGVSIEYQVALANRLHADPWFTVPYQASDDYVQAMATYVHGHLDPGLHPMVEYSNEIWNGAFAPYKYMIDKGMALGLGSPDAKDRPTAGLHYYALRSGQVFDLWNRAYGADAHKISHVIGGLEVWAREADIILGYRDTYRKADVLAVSAYAFPFNLRKITHQPPATAAAQLATIGALSPRQIQANMLDSIADLGKYLDANKAIANKYGLALAIYEGGIDTNVAGINGPLLANKAAVSRAYVAAATSPDIQAVYKALVAKTFDSGASLYNAFLDVEFPGDFGTFGAITYQDQDPHSAPIWQALNAFAGARRTAR